ncbi:hypothetical protein OH492_23270 [Vibrio chagasii]|nr:hypothetical protein [Vibrio chagasii]
MSSCYVVSSSVVKRDAEALLHAFYLSMEYSLLRIFTSDRMAGLIQSGDEGEAIESKMLSRSSKSTT